MTVSLFRFVGWKMKEDECGLRHGKSRRKKRCVALENNTDDSS